MTLLYSYSIQQAKLRVNDYSKRKLYNRSIILVYKYIEDVYPIEMDESHASVDCISDSQKKNNMLGIEKPAV